MDKRKKRKLDMSKEADVQEVMSLLETIDVNDDFLDDIQSDEEASNASRNNTTDDDFEYKNLEQMDDETQEDDATCNGNFEGFFLMQYN